MPKITFDKNILAFLILSGLPPAVIYITDPNTTPPTAAIPTPAVRKFIAISNNPQIPVSLMFVLDFPSVQDIIEVLTPPHVAADATGPTKTPVSPIINPIKSIVCFIFMPINKVR